MGETVRGYGNVEHIDNTTQTIIEYRLTIMSRPGQSKPTPAQLEQALLDFKNAADGLNLDVEIRKVSGGTFQPIQ